MTQGGARNADKDGMSSIGNNPGNLQSIVASTLQNTGLSNNLTALTTAITATLSRVSDSGQLSPFAQVIGALQQIQQNNPAQYQQLTSQIATNLQDASQNALADGNTAAATRLGQLSADFTNASQTGQLPDLQDPTKTVGGHHHGRHRHAEDADTDAGSSPSSPLNPTNIILSTLSAAGISVTGSNNGK